LSDSEEQGYKGAFRTSFKLGEAPTSENPVFLDFQGKEISRVQINDQFVTPS